MWAEFIAEKDTKRSLPAKYATKNTLNIEVIYVRNRFGQVRSGHIKVEHTRLVFSIFPLFSLYPFKIIFSPFRTILSLRNRQIFNDILEKYSARVKQNIILVFLHCC